MSVQKHLQSFQSRNKSAYLLDTPHKVSIRGFIFKWWGAIDKFLFISSIMLIIFGMFFIYLNSHYVAVQHNWNANIFFKKHVAFCVLGIFIMIFLSMLNNKAIFNFLLFVFVVSVILLVLIPFLGLRVKGAKRWISIFGISIQPSEFLKPTLPLFTSYLILYKDYWRRFIYMYAVYPIIFVSLLFEPDFGMTFILLSAIFCQLFVGNVKLKYISIFICIGLSIAVISYLTIPHVHKRIDSFVSKSVSDDDKFGIKFQTYKSMQTISHGGMTGQGLGGGIVKKNLPDLHADFIFAGIAEDCGLIFCLILMILYFFMFVKMFIYIYKSYYNRIYLCMVGMCSSFGLQLLINLASNIGVIPPKGTTLPFISYGGSSMMSVCVLIGSVLGFIKNVSIVSKKSDKNVYKL